MSRTTKKTKDRRNKVGVTLSDEVMVMLSERAKKERRTDAAMAAILIQDGLAPLQQVETRASA